MKYIQNDIASAVTCWWVMFSFSITMHRDWCVGAESPWGIGKSGRLYQHQHHHHRHRRNDERRGSIITSSLHGRPIVAAAVPSLLQQQQVAVTNFPRGGYERISSWQGFEDAAPTPSSSFVKVLGTITQLLISMGRAVLPPLVGAMTGIVKFYQALPMDAITAQIGMVYCFLGGYYPTLFSSLQAAKYCGWKVMVRAVSDLTDEAIKVIDEMEDSGVLDGNNNNSDNEDGKNNLFLRQTHIVLKTVDPAKINTAAGALYTTWLGISSVLQREYARVISLSLTLSEGIETAANIFLLPALNLVTPKDYRRWVPVLLGWSAKVAAMKVAWRIERVLTAATSAIAGGAMVARSLTKILVRRKQRQQQQQTQQQQQSQRSMVLAYSNTTNGTMDDYDDDDETNLSFGEQVVGFAVGGLGFYTQLETQYKQKFSFAVPFPVSLVTWPFDLAERSIQWYITERSR
jgi:hypothetical protein